MSSTKKKSLKKKSRVVNLREKYGVPLQGNRKCKD